MSGLLVVLLGSCYVAYALLRPLPPIPPREMWHFSRTATPVDLSWPANGAAAVGAVGYGVLETHGADQPLPTASTIKILTALAVLQKKPLRAGEQGPMITIGQADIDSYNKYVSLGGSVVRVSLGEQLSEYQALQALLLPSANNIAETLARWTFGTVEDYAAYANTYARQLGMASTTVTDPSGFLPTTVSTPHDLVLLGEAAMNQPVVTEIVDQSSATIPVHGVVRNVNFLLGHNGIIGIKTGNTDDNPGCFIFAARPLPSNDSVVIVGAIMSGQNLVSTLQSSLPLISSAAGGFVNVPVVESGTVVGRYAIPWQGSVAATANKAETITIWKNSTTSASADLTSQHASANADQAAGTITIHNSNLLQDVSLAVTLQQRIITPSIWWRLTHPR